MAGNGIGGTAGPGSGADRTLSRRAMLKLSLLGGGALIAGPGLLAACSTSSSGGGSGSSGGQNLTVGVVGDISNFDSYYDDGEEFIILANLNTFLIDYNDKLEPSPAALTKWELNSAHTQATLTLRPDVKLQTGKTWTADDLVYGFKRAANPSEGQQLYGPMSIVKSYKATDSHTVVLTFTQPVAEGLVTDLLESFPAMDKAVNNSKALASKPGSGGPFRLVSRDPGNSLVIGRFADYWNAKDVYLDKVTFRIFNDADSMVAALQSGSVDAIYNFPPKNAAQLKSQFNVITGYPGALVDCLRMNPNVAPFDNIKVRQAVARALDRDRIVKEVYFGYSQPLYLPWGPNSPANDPAYAQKNSFDLAAAKNLLQEAGSPPRAEALADGSDSVHLQMLQILQQTLQQIGFKLSIKTMDTQTFNQNVVSGKFGILFDGLGNTSKSSPSRIATNSIFRTENNVVLKDKLPKEYVDAIAASERAVTQAEAKAAYAKLNEVISTQAFGVAVCVLPTLIATKKSVTGVYRTVDNWLTLEGAKVSS